jgi:hypothetical protein
VPFQICYSKDNLLKKISLLCEERHLKKEPGEQRERRLMTEKVIRLEDIDPVVMFGPNNRLLEQIQGYYPKVKLIARGGEIKCIGEEEEVNLFAARMYELIEYYKH